ncbi:O-antigen ligase family protein [Oceanimonas baumannii]|uniref:Ligase n=1 Tax=Oceanimonas baumannii TaxID=129578 RepID=A0A235CM57_9GAMM|nr:O-antigen ligase [Oceanimonas baumannii]OYD25678.1 ligase [Oceanimonas baumannii]TDW56995.1 O-antigen ligase [Oceanimonas baumannii]
MPTEQTVYDSPRPGVLPCFSGRNYSSLAVFLMGAIALVVDSGYTYGVVLLLLGSLSLLWRTPGFSPGGEDKLLMAVLAAYSLIFMLQLWLGAAGASAYDRPSRFMFAVPVLLFVLSFPPRLGWLWGGLVAGSVATAGWAVWQKLFLGIERATGHTYVIQFGNISMLFGLFCLAGLGWAAVQPNARRWIVLLLLGAVCGALGSLLSGSRGGWVGLPFVFLVLYKAYGGVLGKRLTLLAVAALAGLGALVYALPQTGVQQRVQQAFVDIERYQQGDRESSLGYRFDMWQGAIALIAERPLTGWGTEGYRERMQELAVQGVITDYSANTHAHNEYLDNFARRGIVGLLSLLALYLVPLKLFARRLNSHNFELRAVATAGAILPVAFMDFGLSQVFFAHNSGVMVYAFWLAVLWGTMRAMEQAPAESRKL